MILIAIADHRGKEHIIFSWIRNSQNDQLRTCHRSAVVFLLFPN